jgi:hypothetical protein
MKVTQFILEVGDEELKLFDAMILKREMARNCNTDVRILETFKEGLVLQVENVVNGISLALISDFVNKHRLNMLYDSGVCLISEELLAPLERTYLSE